ncbi:MAG: PD40 domain-containing protein [Candidatus Zixiibacteriota bacterium]|nr:MAG: PD40 domain-containing protein [candidate division Zixibacteria bacterium]
MRKFLITVLFGIIAATTATYAQETYFGKNKVRYKEFDWSYIQTKHFDIYFYEDAYLTAKFAAAVMESSYVEIVEELDYYVRRRIPVFVYNSHNDFQQTNIIPDLLPEGVGGFTESFKNRIVIPFTGSHEEFRHVLHHELTHAVIYDMLFGNAMTSIISRQRLFQMPLWFGEGYAEYSSRHGWDYWSDMYVRDATINGYLAHPDRVGGFAAYKQGQAMVKYIADKYGEKKLGDILRKGKIHLTMNKALKAAVGITLEELWEEFSKEMKRRYWPEIATRKDADEIGKRLTNARKDGSFFNEKPAFSPDGDKIAIFTDRSDYTEIVLISAADGKLIKRLVKAERSGDLESLHWYVSGMSFSPDGRNLVFVAKSGGKEAICFVDVKKGKIYKKKRLDFYNILSPAWSPDGEKIAFSALSGHERDIFVYHINTDETEQITDDRFDDVSPSWLSNSAEIVFASDRPHFQNPVIDHYGHPYSTPGAVLPGSFEYGTYNIFRVETAGLKVQAVDVGPGMNTNPIVSPDGEKIAFVSNRNGIDNIYIGYLDSVKYFAVTDILSGVREVSWSPDGSQLVFSAFHKGAFDVVLLKEIVPAGTNGELAPTDYITGKYDLLDPDKKGRLAHRRMATQGGDSAFAGVQPKSPSDSTEQTATVDAGETEQPAGPTVAQGDTTLTAAKDSAVAETGIYDDEYVFVSDRDESAMDSLFSNVIARDSLFTANALREPPIFDSVPPLTSDGEYRVNKYKVKFTPDYVGGGFAYDTFFGLRGQSVFVFSDYLGNHQIYVATDLVNTIDQSFVQAMYLNHRSRWSFGTGLFHTVNWYLDSRDLHFSDRFYGLHALASRPFSTFSRISVSGSQIFINRKYLEDESYLVRYGIERRRNTKASAGELAWIFDNVLWGYTGPVNGWRAKLSVGSTVDFFDASRLESYSAEFDYRKYWHFAAAVSMAIRFSGGASFGNTPKQYFLGGTTNWIGNRTLDARVYDVENLYFADVVTPLRSKKYYELSGNRYGLMNWELRFPMVEYLALKYPLPIVLSNVIGAVFVDIGSAWTEHGSRQDPVRVATGFGTGMRLNLFGFALLRYDVAWSIDQDPASKDYSVSDKPSHYFSFGADF